MLNVRPPVRPGPPRVPAPERAAAEGSDFTPHANLSGTVLAIVGCALTGMFLSGEQPSDLGHFAALGFGASLVATLAMDLRAGVRNLIRADVLALVAYYFLTFFEFLFPHRQFDAMVTPESARNGIVTILVGAVGLLAGRHLLNPRRRPLQALLSREVPPKMLIAIFWGAFAVGYWHMLLATNFNVLKVLDAMVDARFSQPWGRGRLGDWKALVVELGMLIYLLPPLAGIILARRSRFTGGQFFFVCLGLAFTLFYGFASGTRNVFAAYLVTLLIGYTFAVGPSRQRETLFMAGICAVAMGIATPLMLNFRTAGLKHWLAADYVAPSSGPQQEGVFVDDNLFAICRIIEIFPSQKNYLGLEIPYNALIRPIPRAIWPGKPEGLTYSIEDAMGVEGMTISATFAGEAYMAGGTLGVLAAGLLFGALFGWWNHLGSGRNSELGILIYASGFFSAVISMRSVFAFTTALMPTLVSILLATFLVRKLIALEKRLAQLRAVRAHHTAVGGPRPRR